MTPTLSIIIPLGPQETKWLELATSLHSRLPNSEIILVGIGQKPDNFPSNLLWLQSPPGRAKQLNVGAAAARAEHLWFVHADSTVSELAFKALESTLQKPKRALYFFDLTFDGPPLMKINSFGVWIRSHLFKMPFGDQGFFLSKNLFFELGGYDERAPYGEDHLLVWKAHQNGIPVLPTCGTVTTSARKYIASGWLKTTLNTVQMTWLQAAPEIVKTFSKKVRREF